MGWPMSQFVGLSETESAELFSVKRIGQAERLRNAYALGGAGGGWLGASVWSCRSGRGRDRRPGVPQQRLGRPARALVVFSGVRERRCGTGTPPGAISRRRYLPEEGESSRKATRRQGRGE
jgi:hypothetical protein